MCQMKISSPVNNINIIGHKGISIYKVPENTIPALERALEEGFLIETDLQKIKDGYILVHDKYIPGLNEESNYEGRSRIESHYGNGFYFPVTTKLVSECTVNELLMATVYCKERHESALSNHAGEPVSLEIHETPKIATFSDLISLLKKFPHSRIFLEIKRPDAYVTYDDGMEEEVIGMLSDSRLLDNIIINTGNESTLRNVRKANSFVLVSIDTDYADVPNLAHNMDEVRRLIGEIGLNFWNPPFFEVDKKLLEDTERLGIEVATWVQNETIKEELSEIKRLKSIGVRYLFTDQSEKAREICSI